MRSADCARPSAGTVNTAAKRKPVATIWKKRVNAATAETATMTAITTAITTTIAAKLR